MDKDFFAPELPGLNGTDLYIGGLEAPGLLGLELSHNERALRRYAEMPDERRRRVADHASGITQREEMRQYVTDMEYGREYLPDES